MLWEFVVGHAGSIKTAMECVMMSTIALALWMHVEFAMVLVPSIRGCDDYPEGPRSWMD